MLNKTFLKVKLPYAKDDTDIKGSLNYIVKTLNSTYLPSESTDSFLSKLGITFSQSYAAGASPFTSSFTFNHDFGFIPSGFMIIDNTHPANANGADSFTRASWTSTQITITISITTGIVGAFNGSFKILVLR